MKLWQGRFSKAEDEKVNDFNKKNKTEQDRPVSKIAILFLRFSNFSDIPIKIRTGNIAKKPEAKELTPKANMALFVNIPKGYAIPITPIKKPK